MNNRGVTFIELLVVVSIVGILIVALAFQFQGWQGKYKAESQMKELYVDLMNARARAMQHNRIHFVSLTATSYSVYEDTNPAPDGNGTLEVAADTLIVRKDLDPTYAIAWTTGNPLQFTRDGLLAVAGLGRINVNMALTDVDYDCIDLAEQTRINLGNMDGAGVNCEPK
jgi:prepilin-type N-terminal cleavage/methylation domain-containing protein